ncbi:hypothetical protein AVEN_185225-1 [Araneus ventricosus]|uniref:Uncharacterized protein n=1 Tax=Araneus ventricosus TaxID=182803 RepID=A0A4Y2RIK4_ARAVE|nr:hypothetical protein AVEN_185225-1 [Araneus ventricosus]
MKLEFQKWFEESGFFKNWSVSRCFYSTSSGQHGINVHTFCDAYQVPYTAAVLVRFKCVDVVQVNLLAAKSRVASVKTTTILRLQLLAVTGGERLCRSVLRALQWEQVVEGLIMTVYKKNSNAGLQMLLNILREHYWIFNARKTVGSV